jgi:hypothetical protein
MPVLENTRHELFAQARRYYVYALVDPRNGETFYIGKGTGNRKSQHTARVRAGRYDDNGVKCERIADILRAGLLPEERIVSDGLTETEAFRRERELIAESHNLTNISGGCRSSIESTAAQARLGLAQLKRFDHWTATANEKQREAAIGVFGSMKDCDSAIRSSLSEIADLVPA